MTMTILVRNRAKDPGYSVVSNGPGPGLAALYQSLLPVLHTLGDVEEVDADTDLPSLCRTLREHGNEPLHCVFGLPAEEDISDCCPVVIAMAWPFEVLPTDSAERWQHLLLRCAGAITFCQQSADAIRQLMGERYPVLVSPAQPWERFAGLAPADGALPSLAPRVIQFTGQLLDSPSIGLSVEGLARQEPAPEPAVVVIEEVTLQVQTEAEPLTWRQRLNVTRALMRGWWREVTAADHPAQAPGALSAEPECLPELAETSSVAPSGMLPAEPQRITLHGVVYTSILRAEDETRNWTEMLTAFCRTFRNQPDATLVVKFSHENLSSGRIGMLTNLSRLSPFKCRVVVINGHLDECEYTRLIAASHYLVHPALSESSAITVQEFMSAGRPILAPRHSALNDWLEADHPLILRCGRQPAHWAGDPDKRLRYFDYRLNWQSMCSVFRSSFDLAVREPCTYQALSAQARAGLEKSARLEQLKAQWGAFFTEMGGGTLSQQVAEEVVRAGA
ncbi:glycosyltransferase [Pseudomonas nicosulfuronedens]